ncbi:MAG TPA: hypothetical protein VGK54_07970 [Chloroflexota bacterium]|jgi:hypothetical protein
MNGPFKWRSWLGVGVGFFLLYGVLNFVAAGVVPSMLLIGSEAGSYGAGAMVGPKNNGGGVVFDGQGDTALLGQSLYDLHRVNPNLDALLVSSMVSMCAMMMGLAVLYMAVAWFAVRRAQRWALWTLLVGGLISLPYYFVIAADYAAHGAPWERGLISLFPLYLPVVLGFAAAWWGLRRPHALQREL